LSFRKNRERELKVASDFNGQVKSFAFPVKILSGKRQKQQRRTREVSGKFRLSFFVFQKEKNLWQELFWQLSPDLLSGQFCGLAVIFF
jgi:hypothetical protein